MNTVSQASHVVEKGDISFAYSPAKPLNNPTHLSKVLKSYGFVSAGFVSAESPWLGLYAHKEETQEYFFGRNSEISDMFTRVRENPLTILFGQSGLGKTSLLSAGLLPKLKAGRYRPVLLRLDFSETAAPLLVQTSVALCSVLSVAITDSDTSLWDILHRISSQPEDLRDQPPVLIFDQFEEIFTQSGARSEEVLEWFTQISCLVENRTPTILQERLRTDRELARQFNLSPTPARVVITLREDYLSHLERWKGALPSLMRNRMALQPLSGPQALEAVVRPGCLGTQQIVSEEVGAQIVRKVAQRPDSTPLEDIEVVPPFLSLLCEQLNAARLKATPPMWQITAELVTTLGDNIIGLYYEESFKGLPVEMRYFVEDKLVSSGGYRNTVIFEDALSDLKAAGLDKASETVDTLITSRLLTVEKRDGLARLELTHDILTEQVILSRTVRQEREAKVRRVRITFVTVIAFIICLGLVLHYLNLNADLQKAKTMLQQTNNDIQQKNAELVRKNEDLVKVNTDLKNERNNIKFLNIKNNKLEAMIKTITFDDEVRKKAQELLKSNSKN